MVPEHYDPMIAKIIASGPTRDAARMSLIEALRETVVLGIATNRERLIQVLESEQFKTGNIHTGVLEEIGPLPPEPEPWPEDLAFIVAALEAAPSKAVAGVSAGPARFDPWGLVNGWRLS